MRFSPFSRLRGAIMEANSSSAVENVCGEHWKREE
jgi:hypothetical protein